MTREEAIKKLESLKILLPAAKDEISGIIKLIETPWISVKEDLPCNHKELINPNFKKETLLVLAITPSGYAFFDYMVYKNVWFWNNRNYCHAYWFPIPELPKE